MNPQNIKVFHLSPHLIFLKYITKFVLKISQFEFLVTTVQSVLVYELFLSLNIPDFSLSFVEKLQPP